MMAMLCLLSAPFVNGQTNVSGNQSGTWTLAGSPYILTASVTVPAGQTLTIQPGVVVQFRRFSYNLTVNGSLQAVGTGADSIRFVGKADPAYSPASNYGGTIYLNSNASTLSYVRIDSLGDIHNNGPDGAIDIRDTARPVINRTLITNTESPYAIYTWAGGAERVFLDNAVIGVRPETLTRNAVLVKTGANSYYRLLGTLSVGAGTIMTMQPGTILHFPRYNYNLTVNGSLQAVGSPTDSIRFIGKADPAYSPSSNYGGTVYLNSNASTLSYIRIDSLGDVSSNGVDGAINIRDTATPVINNCRISNSEGAYAINTWAGGASQVFLNNTVIGVRADNIIRNCTLVKTGTNSWYRLTGTLTVNAGTTMTIQPGTVIHFPRYNYNLVINGSLQAIGTPADSIRFVGKADPAYSPSSNYGGSVYLNSNASTLSYVRADSLGDVSYNGDVGAISIRDTAKPVINHSLINHTESAHAILTWAGGAENIAADNTVIGIRSSTVTANSTLPRPGTGSSYRLLGTVTVNAGKTLTIQPGCRIAFSDYSDRLTVNGTLIANGTAADSIWFTGGFNNGRTHAGIINIGTTSTGSSFRYGSFDSLASTSISNSAVIWAEGPVAISNSSIRNFQAYGVRIERSNVSLTNCQFSAYGSAREAVSLRYDTISPVVQSCTFNGIVPSRTIAASPGTISGFSNNTNAIIELNGNVPQHAQWQKPGTNSMYKVGNVTVQEGKTLTIQPGCRIWMSEYSSYFNIYGTLAAEGTAADSIRFFGGRNTNYAYGGSIRLWENSKASTIRYVSFDSLAYPWNASYDAVVSAGGPVAISNSSFRNSYGYAVDIEKSNVSITNCTFSALEAVRETVYLRTDTISPVITGCVFAGNTYARTLHASPGTISGISNNTNAIIELNGSVPQHAQWQKPGTNSMYKVGNVTVQEGKTLTIQPGCRIWMSEYSSYFNIYGTLVAEGTAADSIRFFGGRNNNYAYGGSIRIWENATASSIRYVSFDSLSYPWTGSYDAVVSAGGPVTISNSSFRNYFGYAVDIERSKVSLTNCTFSALNTGRESIYLRTDTIAPAITGCTFAGNTDARTLHASPGSISGISNNTNAIIDLTGAVTQHATWPKPGPGSFYRASNVVVNAQKTLTIQPGSRIQLPYYYSQFYVYGTLIANGTAADSIRFFGGYNNNGYSHGGGISIESGSTGSSIQYASFDSLAYSYFNNSAAVKASAPLVLSHSTIRNFFAYAVSLGHSDVSVTDCSIGAINNNYRAINFTTDTIAPIIQRCSFYGNTNGRSIYPYMKNLPNIHSNYNAIVNLQNTYLSANATLVNPGENSNYALPNALNIPASITLTIEPGVIIDFINYYSHVYVYGTLRALGSESAPIQFTTLNGINNGGTVYLYDNSNAVVSNTLLTRMGGNGYALYLGNNVNTQLVNITISSSPGYGMYIASGSPVITGSTIIGNNTGIVVNSGSPVFTNCNILGNTQAGIMNYGSGTVDARNSWWGSATGPLHTTTNPGGTGNSVSDRVLYDPWKNKPAGNQVNDIGITAIPTPFTNCGLTATSKVKVRIRNNGNTPQTGFTVSYRINNGAVITENVGSLTITPASTTDYEFNTTANLAATGQYTIRAYTSLETDSFHLNDTTQTIIQHLAALTAPGNLLPSNNAPNLDKPVTFSWGPVTNAASYELYVWPAAAAAPTTPTVQGIVQINYVLYSDALQFGDTYKWKVVAVRDSCRTESAVQQFTLRNLPDLIVASVTVPPAAVSETEISFSWRTKNQGTGSTRSADWYERAYLSDAPRLGIGNDYYIGSYKNFSALEAGQTYDAPAKTYRIPEGLQGQYYLIITTGENYYSNFELTDTNNLRASAAIAITLAPPPDLQITALAVSPATAFSEDTLTINWTITNKGVGPTNVSSWYDMVYLSANPLFNPVEATVLYTAQHTGSLQVEGTYNSTTKIKIPQNLQGTYYVHVQTDRYANVFEYDKEDNNTTASPELTILLRPHPDLIVDNITVPYDSVSAGQSITLQWTTANDGSMDISRPWTETLYISTDTTLQNWLDIPLLTYQQNNPLLSLSVVGVQSPAIIPADLPEGKYYFICRTDAGNSINEFPFDDNNTSRAAGPVFVGQPDLVMTAPQAPAGASSEQAISVGYTVQNNGKGNLTGRSWVDKVYLSTDMVWSIDDKELGTVSNNSVQPRNSSYNKQLTVTLPAGISGNYYLLFVADANNSILESNNNNNLATAPVAITLSPWADLQVSNVTAPPQDTAGRTMQVSYTVTNTGNGAIQNKQWSERIYLSPSNSLTDAGNILLTTVAQNRSLTNGQSYSVQSTVMVPLGQSAGQYYVVVETDANGQVFEHTGESNNRNIGTAIQVAPLPNVDLAVNDGAVQSAALLAGQSVNLTYTTKNAGTTNTLLAEWTDAVYLSNNTVIDGADRLLGQWTVNNVLLPNGSIAYQRTVTIPNTVSGNFYLIVLTDRDNQQNDINRGNNFLVLNTNISGQPNAPIVITQPTPSDLQPLSLSAPAEAFAGEAVWVKFTVKNNGPGVTTSAHWNDFVFVTDEPAMGSGPSVATKTKAGPLAANGSYTDSVELILHPSLSGNYYVVLRTDANNSQYEQQGEDNNTAMAGIFIKPQLPCDLVINQVTPPAGSQLAGQPTTIQWQLGNSGQNPAYGYLKEAVYLSLDTVFDAADILLGTKEENISLLPGLTLNRTLTAPLNNITLGNYYIIVRTDILNSLVEAQEDNNTRASSTLLSTDVKALVLAVPTADVLMNGQALYYRLHIPASLHGETMQITLSGDTSKHAVNRIYLKHGAVPAPNNYDQAAEIPFETNQQLIVPAADSGTYYLLFLGNDTTVLRRQSITLEARIIPFQITAVDAGRGGNTGGVTVKIEGANFEPSTQFVLRKAGLPSIYPYTKYYIDASHVFVSYNLQGTSLGVYDVVAIKQDGDSTKLLQGFEIVRGPGSALGGGGGNGNGSGGPGGGTGFVCQVVNIGYEDLISTDFIHAESTRLNRVEPITIVYENTSTIDIPLPTRFFISLTGAPISFTVPGLDENKTTLPLSFTETGAPPGILRAGAKGFIKVFTKAITRGVAELTFAIIE